MVNFLPTTVRLAQSILKRKFPSVDKSLRIQAPPKISPSKRAFEKYKPVAGITVSFLGQVSPRQQRNGQKMKFSMPLTSFPAELHSIKLRFVFGAGALTKIWTCFHFFESISILLSRSHTFPFRTFLYLLLLATLSSFFPTQFCLANFPILEKKGILSVKDSRSGGGEIGSGFFPKCLAELVRLCY